MHAPDADELRPGDAVKVRGTGSPAHTGARALVAAVHRDPAAPGRVAAVSVRYSARGPALRVDLSGPGELVRFADPWPAHRPARREAAAAPAAGAAPPAPSRRALAAGAGALLVVAGALALLVQAEDRGDRADRAPARPVLAQAAPAGSPTGSSTGSSTGSPASAPASTGATPPPAGVSGEVVAWAAGAVPVVGGAGAPRPLPLAGVEPVPGCRDAYAAALRELLPVGTAVTVSAAGSYRTGAGLAVGEELVRRGVARATGTTGATGATATTAATGAPGGTPSCA
ncbi:hypothetical protein [Kineococcus gypseus]|uniref:hypothetical protein n=1 Tax=Kineococcus gypseus TaxID=1637102 RepID=UPI003D7CE447